MTKLLSFFVLTLALVLALLPASTALVSTIVCGQLPALTGAVTTSSGSCTTSVGLARVAGQAANPVGTTSSTQVMAGLAGAFIPAVSGNAFITIQGVFVNGTAGDGCLAQIRTGTGTAPANGVAATGTARGQVLNGQTSGTNTFIPFTLVAYVTGLTVNTTYWIDVGFAAVTGGTCTPANFYIVAIEE